MKAVGDAVLQLCHALEAAGLDLPSSIYFPARTARVFRALKERDSLTVREDPCDPDYCVTLVGIPIYEDRS